MPTLDELLQSLDSYTSRLSYNLAELGAGTAARPFAKFSSCASEAQLNKLPAKKRAETVLSIVAEVAKRVRDPEVRVVNKYCVRTANAILKAVAKEEAAASKAKSKAASKSKAAPKSKSKSKSKSTR